MMLSEVNVTVAGTLYLYLDVTSQFTAESPESVKERLGGTAHMDPQC